MLTRLLQQSVQARPSKAAVVQGNRRLSWAELDSAVARCAGFLRKSGVGEGDCVAVALPNSPEFVIAFFAIVRLRAVMLPLNPGYQGEEMRRFLAERPARVLITDARREAQARDCAGDALVVVAERTAWESCEPLAAVAAPFSGDALYLYTSGSTDSFKRVCCTQENLYYEAHNFVETIGLTADDNILCTIPLYHSYGLGNCLLDAAYAGCTLVLEPDSDAPFAVRCPRVLELLREENIRVYPGVPYQFDVLASSPEDLGSFFRDVRWCISSGDVLPLRVYERFAARTGRPIRSLYGSTEAGSISMNIDPDSRMEYGSLGRPLMNVAIEIRGEGEIWVKSPTIPPSGYENRPDLTPTVFRDGFYHTGDIGYLNERGHLILAGRRQSFINIAGYKVDTAEVEEVLASCPGVREAAVLGVEVPRMGMIVKAAVVTGGRCTDSALRAFCKQRLAFFKVPRFIQEYPALPRSAVGKVLKSDLGGTDEFLKDVRGTEAGRTVATIRVSPPARRRSLIASLVRAQTSAVLGRPVEDIPPDAGFVELGMDSFGAIELQTRLEYLFSTELSPTFTFDHPTVEAVVENLPIERALVQ